MPELTSVKISEIKVDAYARRPIDQNNVDNLLRSIQKIGLLHPITITKDNRLVTGYHRLKAYESLAWEEIPCIITEFEGEGENLQFLEKLAEIDENLIRAELHFLDRSKQLLSRKEIYEKLYPESKHGGDRKSEKIKSQNLALDKNKTSFVGDTANKTGKSESTIKDGIVIAKKLIPEAYAIIKEKDISKFHTLQLAKKTEEIQKSVLKLLEQGKTITEAFEDCNITTKKSKITPEITQSNQTSEEQITTSEQDSFAYEKDVTYQDNSQITTPISSTSPNVETIDRITEGEYERFDIIYADLSSNISCKEKEKLQTQLADDSVFFLWATPKELLGRINILKELGFNYVTHFILRYDSLAAGEWNKKQHDVLLLAIKGNFVEPKQKFSSIIKAEGVKIGMRPVEVQCMIEQMYPDYKYLELNVGSNREGWYIRKTDPGNEEYGIKKEQNPIFNEPAEDGYDELEEERVTEGSDGVAKEDK